MIQTKQPSRLRGKSPLLRKACSELRVLIPQCAWRLALGHELGPNGEHYPNRRVSVDSVRDKENTFYFVEKSITFSKKP